MTGKRNGKIDRISESTNFNGIQLLDGTLGAREGAFTTARTGAVAGIDVNISSLLPTAATAANAASDTPVVAWATNAWHESVPKKDEVKPEFTVNFADINIKGLSSAATASGPHLGYTPIPRFKSTTIGRASLGKSYGCYVPDIGTIFPETGQGRFAPLSRRLRQP